jgi:hypothetical protein
MSRNIPQVRRWRVRYYLNDLLLAEIVVDAPNKMFAKWSARDRAMSVGHWERVYGADRVTCTLAPRETIRSLYCLRGTP